MQLVMELIMVSVKAVRRGSFIMERIAHVVKKLSTPMEKVNVYPALKIA